jgi:hypothetical protein
LDLNPNLKYSLSLLKLFCRIADVLVGPPDKILAACQPGADEDVRGPAEELEYCWAFA